MGRGDGDGDGDGGCDKLAAAVVVMVVVVVKGVWESPTCSMVPSTSLVSVVAIVCLTTGCSELQRRGFIREKNGAARG